ncbi:twin-arginine translocation signal domain-containing protein [Halorussus pelagicus]|uniref:twin-arginine translocation signal domain-containing protein n=1 Tax=Halorussus pelagicus TaxID=2505977 RepID=UPI000FFCBFC2|nr:twin-arginine translocation signal domain-containing protein [Halorussus pelagicus]
MSEKDDEMGGINRRNLIKSSAAAGALGTSGGALSSVFGTVRAEEATASDIEQIKQAPGVQQILDELGVESLPDPEKVEKRRLEGDGEVTDGELVMMKVELKYGTLLAAKRNGQIGTVFTFDRDLSSAPTNYSIVTETGGSIASTRSDVEFARGVTDAEEERVLSTLDVDGKIERTRIQATTAIDGFRVKLAVTDPETDELETPEYLVNVGRGFDPKSEEFTGPSASLRSVSASGHTSQRVTTEGIGTKIIADILKDWLLANVISGTLDELGIECDDTCTNCGLWIYDVVTACGTCVGFCSSSVSGVGAILCVACFYAFCSKPISGEANCAACMACLLTGDEPDVPPNPPNAFLNWVWDELPSPPSLPSI